VIAINEYLKDISVLGGVQEDFSLFAKPKSWLENEGEEEDEEEDEDLDVDEDEEEEDETEVDDGDESGVDEGE